MASCFPTWPLLIPYKTGLVAPPPGGVPVLGGAPRLSCVHSPCALLHLGKDSVPEALLPLQVRIASAHGACTLSPIRSGPSRHPSTEVKLHEMTHLPGETVQLSHRGRATVQPAEATRCGGQRDTAGRKERCSYWDPGEPQGLAQGRAGHRILSHQGPGPRSEPDSM